MLQGLLLDLDAATLTVWVNGERKGVMARPGMTNAYGDPVGRLEGPLRRAVDLSDADLGFTCRLPRILFLGRSNVYGNSIPALHGSAKVCRQLLIKFLQYHSLEC